MQNKKELTKDTRTFKEIFDSLTGRERVELCRKLIVKRCCGDKVTFYSWAKGRIPQRRVRSTIAKIVGNFIGAESSEETLFPTAYDSNRT